MTTHIGIVVAERGSAIVTVERNPDDELLVSAIERLPFSLAAVVARVRELDAPERRFTIDGGDGIGAALWAVVGDPDDKRWQLYAGRGIERQALVDELLVAIAEDRFHFAPGLAEQEAMNKALLGYRRQVREDGLIGSELVVALLLAIIPPKPALKPFVIWAGARDEVDGTNVSGHVLRRTRDGGLVAVQLPKADSTPTNPDGAA
jgi:hypothetical protein